MTKSSEIGRTQALNALGIQVTMRNQPLSFAYRTAPFFKADAFLDFAGVDGDPVQVAVLRAENERVSDHDHRSLKNTTHLQSVFLVKNLVAEHPPLFHNQCCNA